MTTSVPPRRAVARPGIARLWPLLLVAGACAPSTAAPGAPSPSPGSYMSAAAPAPDPRVGLGAGLLDAGEAAWNLRVLSRTPPPKEFVGHTNSDLAFTGDYAIQGNYQGYQIWDISDPARPSMVTSYVCPSYQGDVSVYRNLLFVSVEGSGRLDCGTQGIRERVSGDRLLGLRIFDISDVRSPKYVGNVQTCRGSHTHTVLEDPRDPENVYIYISGSNSVRPAEELPGCSGAAPSEDPNSALFRIEIVRVPLAHPERAAIVSSPRIFHDLVTPPLHGLAPDDRAAMDREVERERARGAFIVDIQGDPQPVPLEMSAALLDSIARARGGSGPPTAADSAALREALPGIVARMLDRGGPTQCHDITVFPAIGLAAGACEGYGFLLDIRDPVNPRRIAAVSDSNFAYWHSATFNNDGTSVLFTDEWGGGHQPKCRATDPKEWGANAIFTVENGRMEFRSYYKLPAPQTQAENCVAHNGSLVPIPGRDVMVQAWYQGGVSVFDWTDPSNPVEIAFHDRGPVNANAKGVANGGSWSAYWYNGVIVSSEKLRGLDVFELTPSAHLSQNEIEAANTVKLDYLNAQGQPRFVWPASFALVRAYVDQLERTNRIPAEWISGVRRELTRAESASGTARTKRLTRLAQRLDSEADRSLDAARVRRLAEAARRLAEGTL